MKSDSMAAPGILLVEGVDDKHVILALLAHHGLQVEVTEMKGVSNLPEVVGGRLES